MNPLIYVLVAAALVAGGGVTGWRAAMDHRDAIDLAEFKGKSDALTATAQEIAKIDVRNVTIRQKVETQIKEIPVYRDCKNTPEVMSTINEELKGGAK